MISPRWLLLCVVCTGCEDPWNLLDAQAQAYGDQAAAEAGPPLRAVLGLSALAATLCRFTQTEWQAMPDGEPILPQPLVDWFGADPIPALKRSEDQGLVTVFYTGASSMGRQGALRATVLVPLTILDLELTDGGAAGPARVAMRATTGGCLGDERAVNGMAAFTAPGTRSWRVEVPADVSTGHLEFLGGEALPFTGDVSWSGRMDVGRIAVTTTDAAELTDLLWPARAVSADLSVPVTVDLSGEADTASE